MEKVERKLAAIMFTDIVGYTALMGTDEDRAFQLLKINRQLQKPIIEKYGGTLLKEIGDGILASFLSDTNAVYCAKEIQNLSLDVPDLQLRIGIHEGEVIFDNEDVFGDGVNIASRLQSIAPAESIYISESIFRNIENKKDIETQFIKEEQLKNVKHPIRIFQVRVHQNQVFNAFDSNKKRQNATIRSLKNIIFLLLTMFIFCIGILIGIWQSQKPDELTAYLNMNLPEGIVVDRPGAGYGSSIAISPDGKNVVFTGRSGNQNALYKRFLGSPKIDKITGTDDATNPFFSPNGKWIGFQVNNALYKISVNGGEPHYLCDALWVIGCIWLKNDSILFGGYGKGIKIISSNGSPPRDISFPDYNRGEWSHTFPSALSSENKILYSKHTVADEISINLLDLNNGEDKVLIQNASNPIYTETGHIVYKINGVIYADRFNDKKEQMEMDPVQLVQAELRESNYYVDDYSLARNGTLVYIIKSGDPKDDLVFVNMNGEIKPVSDVEGIFFGPKYSPDGQNLAFWRKKDGSSQVWIYNLEREQFTMFTSFGENFWPIWSPDGRNIAFPSIREGSLNVNSYTKPYGKTGNVKALVINTKANQPKLWTNDGKQLLYHQFEEQKGCDLYILNIDDMKAEPFLAENYNEGKPDFSPYNKWIIYESDETGKYEVYITDFPDKKHKVQVSISGGYEPLWSHSGNKVFYRYKRDFYSVNVSIDDEKIVLGKSELLFSGDFKLVQNWGRSYDLSPVEDTFVMVREIEYKAVRSLNVVSDIFTEIKMRENVE